MSDYLHHPLPADFAELLVRKGHYAGHAFAKTQDAELRWLWGEVRAHVLDPYPFAEYVGLDFALAYNDNWYAPHTSLEVDGVYAEWEATEANYNYMPIEYAADGDREVLPTAAVKLDTEFGFSLADRLGYRSPSSENPNCTYDQYFALMERAIAKHYGHYRAPLLRAHNLFGAMLHDFREGYFTWLFGYNARVVFTREGVEVGPGQEFGSTYTPGGSIYRGLGYAAATGRAF